MPEEFFLSSLAELRDHLKRYQSLESCTLHGLDLHTISIEWEHIPMGKTSFMGCVFPLGVDRIVRERKALIMPALTGLPYKPYRHQLYHWKDLLAPSEENPTLSNDLVIYQHFSAQRYRPELHEALFQRIHDHSIDQALRNLIGIQENGLSQKACVGFMGGHSTLRNDPNYRLTARTAFLVAKAGYYVVSGGGPGIMEATNLGAYFAAYEWEDLQLALKRLETAPHYTDDTYFESAKAVLSDFPDGNENLAIPTWFYGHEPSNLFATHIAKYFSNSLREDNLLAICLHGVVFAPGNAGTTQEIFQDAAQNHYGTYGYFSPMVFLSQKRYEIETLIFPLLRQLAWDKEYYDFLYLTDKPEKVLGFLQTHPPKPVPKES